MKKFNKKIIKDGLGILNYDIDNHSDEEVDTLISKWFDETPINERQRFISDFLSSIPRTEMCSIINSLTKRLL